MGKIAEWGVFVALVIGLGIAVQTCSAEADKRKVAEQNTVALASEITEYETKNGQLVSVAEGLRLDVHDLEAINSELYNQIDDLNIKLKDARAAVKVETKYVYSNPDTVRVVIHETDSTYVAHLDIDEPYLVLGAEIDLRNQVMEPNSLHIEVPNDITLVEAIKRKGWFIFKRKVGVEVQVINSNPYVHNSDILYIDLR